MRIIFLGRRPHACEALDWLLTEGHEVVRVVAPSGVDGEREYWSPSLRESAARTGLSLSSDVELYREIASGALGIKDVDLVVSFLFWKRIRRPFIDGPRFGCVNLHPAPLPDYGGLGGYNFAILHKLAEWGVTSHYVDDGFDTGPIIRVDRFSFDWRSATAFSLEMATRPVLLECFKQTVRDIAKSGRLSTVANQGGRYYDRADFECEKVLDLDNMSNDEVLLRTRAFWYPPFDGAYVERDGQRFTLVTSDILESLEILHRER